MYVIFTDILGRNNINRWLAAYMIPPHRRAHPFFPKIRPHAPDTLQTPLHHRLVGWEGRNACYGWLPVGTERDSKFAIKAGMATSRFACFFGINSTHVRGVLGDWALISVSLFSPLSFGLVDTCDQVFYRDFVDNRVCECLLWHNLEPSITHFRWYSEHDPSKR